MAGALLAASLSLSLAGPSSASVVETTTPGENLGFLTDTEVQMRRDELGFARAFDGKVAIQNPETKSLWDLKLDSKSPGTILLRSPEGQVHVLAFSAMQQIDLSDDEVVAAIANSQWEKAVQPVQAEDDNKALRKLELTREGFYDLMSILQP